MTDTTDIKALKINTYSVNSNDAWPQCADDDRTGSYVKWEDVVKLLSAQCKGNEHETGFDSLKNLKFVADCCIENPDSIYASEFFLLLDEMFGKQGDYSMPVQAVAVSHLLRLLEAERQRSDAVCRDIRIQANDLKSAQTVNKVLQAELAALKGDQVPSCFVSEEVISKLNRKESCYGFMLPTLDTNDRFNTPLFTAPQKPVVLPEMLSALYRTGFNESYRAIEVYRVKDVKAAIEAAGGSVKDGE